MAARTCAECAHAHARDTRSLRSLVGPHAAPTFPPQDATNTTKPINQHKQARKSLARSARSWAPLRPQHSHHKTQSTPPRQSTNTSRRRSHSLAPLARGPPCGSKIPSTRRDQHQTRGTLARCARSWATLRLPIHSGPPPAPALATLGWASCFLRAGETPALRQQGKERGCAIASPPSRAPFPPVPLPLARSARSMPLRAACLLTLRGAPRA